jgi:hypothetical protein
LKLTYLTLYATRIIGLPSCHTCVRIAFVRPVQSCLNPVF